MPQLIQNYTHYPDEQYTVTEGYPDNFHDRSRAQGNYPEDVNRGCILHIRRFRRAVRRVSSSRPAKVWSIYILISESDRFSGTL